MRARSTQGWTAFKRPAGLLTRFRFDFLLSERSSLAGTAEQMFDDIGRYAEAGVQKISVVHHASALGDLPTQDFIDLWARFTQKARVRL